MATLPTHHSPIGCCHFTDHLSVVYISLLRSLTLLLVKLETEFSGGVSGIQDRAFPIGGSLRLLLLPPPPPATPTYHVQ